MGKDSRQRREARRRAHARAARLVPPHAVDPGAATGITHAELLALIDQASRFAVNAPRALAPHVERLNAVGAAAQGDDRDPAALVVEEVVSRIAQAWEYGWQPQDLVHATRRRTTPAAATWMARAVVVQADRSAAWDEAPEEWADQLRSLTDHRHRFGGADALLPLRGGASVQEWTAALVVLDLVQALPRSQLIGPPPSQWGRAPVRDLTTPRSGDGKVLTRVRALLAKAESTEFSAEAEAFTAKAQDIMTRHSIDEALLADEAGADVDVRARRVLVHHPYAVEKAGLLDAISRANRTRAIWNDFAACMTLVGVPTDLDQIEMLFTSTLVQATTAMTHASHEADRSTSFRKAFLTAYAHRIGERLTASAQAATAGYGTGLVPVLERQGDAIDAAFERLFPHVTTGSRRRSYDARGWDAGTRAADAAVLPAGEVGT